MKGWLFASLALAGFVWLSDASLRHVEDQGFTAEQIRAHAALIDKAVAAAESHARKHGRNTVTRAEINRAILDVFEAGSLEKVRLSAASGEPDGR